AVFTTARHDNAETTSRLLRHAHEQGWETVEYRDAKLGRRSDQGVLERCLNDAKAGKIQGFLCYSVDRLSTEGVGKVMSILATFVRLELRFRFIKDGIDSFDGGNEVVGLIASISRVWRQLLLPVSDNYFSLRRQLQTWQIYRALLHWCWPEQRVRLCRDAT
ncbi:MAG: recombinase family protein, partial [Rhodocyclaceae bacterium]|nr:recombinase family protein [Rhodocyclaceae bacterium]